jgi:single-strand DNA-binding protein
MYSRAIVMGRITADPELRLTENGTPVMSFNVAVRRKTVSEAGERKTDFITIVAWRAKAEFIMKNFTKGNMILVDGSLVTETYEDKNGITHRVVKIIADTISFCGEKSQMEYRAL